MADFEDRHLISRVLVEDDRNAFSELVRRHQSAVRGLLRRLTAGDTFQADDLAQETFLLAYEKLHTFRADARLSTWLYRIAYNLFLSQLRREKARPAPGRAEACVSAPRNNGHLVMDLDRALAVLRPKERAAVLLCCVEELTHPEAAEIMSCPVGSVKTWVLNGKRKLRKRLEAWKDTCRNG